MLSGLYNEPIESFSTYSKTPEEMTTQRVEERMAIAIWFRGLAPLIIMIGFYLLVALSPLREAFCYAELGEEMGAESISRKVHHTLKSRVVIGWFYQLNCPTSGFILSCMPLCFICLLLSMQITSLFEAGFWLRHGRPIFAAGWFLIAVVGTLPFCF